MLCVCVCLCACSDVFQSLKNMFKTRSIIWRFPTHRAWTSSVFCCRCWHMRLYWHVDESNIDMLMKVLPHQVHIYINIYILYTIQGGSWNFWKHQHFNQHETNIQWPFKFWIPLYIHWRNKMPGPKVAKMKQVRYGKTRVKFNNKLSFVLLTFTNWTSKHHSYPTFMG